VEDPGFENMVGRKLGEGKAHNIEAKLRARNGEWHTVLASEALKESREYLNQIINCIGDPIFVKNRDHRIMLVNDAMCAFRTVRRKELIEHIDIPDSTTIHFWEQEEDVLKKGREIISEDRITDGKSIWQSRMSSCP
jgi:PAS domain-containing protein